MKKSILKQIFVVIVFAALASAMTSCNKGYGCPTNFKAVKAAVELVK
jgi:predicted small secreted protein